MANTNFLSGVLEKNRDSLAIHSWGRLGRFVALIILMTTVCMKTWLFICVLNLLIGSGSEQFSIVDVSWNVKLWLLLTAAILLIGLIYVIDSWLLKCVISFWVDGRKVAWNSKLPFVLYLRNFDTDSDLLIHHATTLSEEYDEEFSVIDPLIRGNPARLILDPFHHIFNLMLTPIVWLLSYPFRLATNFFSARTIAETLSDTLPRGFLTVSVGCAGKPPLGRGLVHLSVVAGDWKSVVNDLISSAEVVVLRLHEVPPKTPGLTWEFQQAMNSTNLQKVVLLTVDAHGNGIQSSATKRHELIEGLFLRTNGKIPLQPRFSFGLRFDKSRGAKWLEEDKIEYRGYGSIFEPILRSCMERHLRLSPTLPLRYHQYYFFHLLLFVFAALGSACFVENLDVANALPWLGFSGLFGYASIAILLALWYRWKMALHVI